jgi:hypothetical protein
MIRETRAVYCDRCLKCETMPSLDNVRQFPELLPKGWCHATVTAQCQGLAGVEDNYSLLRAWDLCPGCAERMRAHVALIRVQLTDVLTAFKT